MDILRLPLSPTPSSVLLPSPPASPKAAPPSLPELDPADPSSQGQVSATLPQPPPTEAYQNVPTKLVFSIPRRPLPSRPEPVRPLPAKPVSRPLPARPLPKLPEPPGPIIIPCPRVRSLPDIPKPPKRPWYLEEVGSEATNPMGCPYIALALQLSNKRHEPMNPGHEPCRPVSMLRTMARPPVPATMTPDPPPSEASTLRPETLDRQGSGGRFRKRVPQPDSSPLEQPSPESRPADDPRTNSRPATNRIRAPLSSRLRIIPPAPILPPGLPSPPLTGSTNRGSLSSDASGGDTTHPQLRPARPAGGVLGLHHSASPEQAAHGAHGGYGAAGSPELFGLTFRRPSRTSHRPALAEDAAVSPLSLGPATPRSPFRFGPPPALAHVQDSWVQSLESQRALMADLAAGWEADLGSDSSPRDLPPVSALAHGLAPRSASFAFSDHGSDEIGRERRVHWRGKKKGAISEDEASLIELPARNKKWRLRIGRRPSTLPTPSPPPTPSPLSSTFPSGISGA